MPSTPYQFSQPVWELPEVKEKVSKVMFYISTTLAAKNYFAWRDFVEDLKSDIRYEIYKYEDLYLQGKYHKTSAGGYCHMATQGAKNYVSYYNAQKRKVNYETLSLDALLETDDGAVPFQVADASSACEGYCEVELLSLIGTALGPEVAEMARKILAGEPLGSKQLSPLATKQEQDEMLKEHKKQLQKLKVGRTGELLRAILKNT